SSRTRAASSNRYLDFDSGAGGARVHGEGFREAFDAEQPLAEPRFALVTTGENLVEVVDARPLVDRSNSELAGRPRHHLNFDRAGGRVVDDVAGELAHDRGHLLHREWAGARLDAKIAGHAARTADVRLDANREGDRRGRLETAARQKRQIVTQL